MNVTELRVCTDCILAIGGEIPEDADLPAIAAGIERISKEGALLAGDEDGFSWSPCECCQSPLGGDRHIATILR